ncbi:hypothetical protein L228DRAFT_139519 [Xylona heveae TC161]|uniref:Uncharacterized protein n=1 Tax=Xylona heveae (strain CBS 132557 / TC161) TaxID=1328760 RepID=A0A165H2Z7_XYLHT|nr:hypothetical protein L228DRAFT_139519 [Xylona heveae TC161]KZF22915.1 hypothetical protein L228DRAFT_139519 [Xylona heveae TC161]
MSRDDVCIFWSWGVDIYPWSRSPYRPQSKKLRARQSSELIPDNEEDKEFEDEKKPALPLRHLLSTKRLNNENNKETKEHLTKGGYRITTVKINRGQRKLLIAYPLDLYPTVWYYLGFSPGNRAAAYEPKRTVVGCSAQRFASLQVCRSAGLRPRT